MRRKQACYGRRVIKGDQVSALLEVRGITKSFAGVHALRGVDLDVRPGEVHCVLGQNGAGKSTLIKVLTGALPSGGGTMRLEGQPIQPASPLEAQKLGISTVYQEVNLCPNLSVAENVFAGRYPRRGAIEGFRIDWSAVHRRARELLARIQAQLRSGAVLRATRDALLRMEEELARARDDAESRRQLVDILHEVTGDLSANEIYHLLARRVARALRLLRTKELANPWKKHDNIPL